MSEKFKLNRLVSRQKGFTMAELLVTVVILIIITSVTVFYYGGLTSNARDVRRRADLNYLSKLLAVYYLDHGFFPTYNTAGVSPLSCELTLYPRTSGCNDLLSELRSYSAKLPFDPNDRYLQGSDQCLGGSCYQYITPDPAHSVSCVCARLENAEGVNNPPLCQSNGHNYCLQVSY